MAYQFESLQFDSIPYNLRSSLWPTDTSSIWWPPDLSPPRDRAIHSITEFHNPLDHNWEIPDDQYDSFTAIHELGWFWNEEKLAFPEDNYHRKLLYNVDDRFFDQNTGTIQQHPYVPIDRDESILDTEMDLQTDLTNSPCLPSPIPLSETLYSDPYLPDPERDLSINEELIEGSERLTCMMEVDILFADNIVMEGNDLTYYVILQFAKDKFRTNGVRAAQRPTWEERISTLLIGDHHGLILTISVRSQMANGLDRILGSCSIHLSDYVLDKPFSPLIQLINDSGVPSGDLHIRLLLSSKNVIETRFWWELFQISDVDRRKNLNTHELQVALRVVGCIPLSNKQLESLYKDYDSDHDGRITSEEFTQWAHQYKYIAFDTSSQHSVVQQALVTKNRYEHSQKVVIDRHESLIWFVMLSLAQRGRATIGGNMVRVLLSINGWYEEPGSTPIPAIAVKERYTNREIKERVPIYAQTLSRPLLELKSPSSLQTLNRLMEYITKDVKRRYDSPASIGLIPKFIDYYGVNMKEVENPNIASYQSFNEFFHRRLRAGSRPISSPQTASVAVSPCDCRCLAFPSAPSSCIWVKGRRFSVSSLVASDQLAINFIDGPLLIHRLAPSDYHRFHCGVDGVVKVIKMINGTYYVVSPLTINSPVDVLTENQRAVVLIESREFGLVCYVIVGSCMVGSICFSIQPGQLVTRGMEMGYFSLGGSTIVTMFQRDKIILDSDLLNNSRTPQETLVQFGQSIGRTPMIAPTSPNSIGSSPNVSYLVPPPSQTSPSSAPATPATATRKLTFMEKIKKLVWICFGVNNSD